MKGNRGKVGANRDRIAELAAQGRSNPWIAAELDLTVSDVKNAMGCILREAGLKDRKGLARIAPKLLTSQSQAQLQRLGGLTPTERAVGQLLLSGHSIREIARIRRVREDTVRRYLSRIYQKTGTRNQAELIRLFRY